MTIQKLTDLINTDKNSEGKKFLEGLTKELRKESLVSTGVLAKELNDVDKNLDQVNKNLSKIYESLTTNPLNKKQEATKNKLNDKSISLIQSPDGSLRLLDKKNPVNLKDLFGKFINPNSKKPDSYMFQSSAQYQQREDLRIKLAKKEITQQEFDIENEKIGTTGGLNPINFVKDFAKGMKDTFNFILNRNKIVSTSVNEQKPVIEKTESTTKESNDELIQEIIKIRSLIEKPVKSRKEKSVPKPEKEIKQEKNKDEAIKWMMTTINRIDRMGRASNIIGKADPLLSVKSESKAVDLLMSKLAENQKTSTLVATKVQELTDVLKQNNEENDNSSTAADAISSIATAAGAGAILSKGGKAGKLGGKLLGGAKMIGRAIPGALAVGLGGAVIDSALGAAGVGKMTPEEDEKLQAQDEANWEKMTLGQKIQSGVARGIEKTGSFLFLDNMANQARKERIKSETKYLEENPNNLETKLQVNPDIDQLSRENFELRNNKEQQVSIVNAPTTINQTQQAAPSFNNGTRARPREEYSDSYTRMYMTKVLA